jgi:hypothetical protein
MLNELRNIVAEAARRVEDAPVVGLNDLDEQAHDEMGVELAAAPTFGAG